MIETVAACEGIVDKGADFSLLSKDERRDAFRKAFGRFREVAYPGEGRIASAERYSVLTLYNRFIKKREKMPERWQLEKRRRLE